MPLPNSNRRQFIQEVVEPEVSTPVEPEVLQEIVEEAPAPAKKKKKAAPKIGGRIKKAVTKAKKTVQNR